MDVCRTRLGRAECPIAGSRSRRRHRWRTDDRRSSELSVHHRHCVITRHDAIRSSRSPWLSDRLSDRAIDLVEGPVEGASARCRRKTRRRSFDQGCLRARSAVFAPASCSFSLPLIRSSVNRDRFICPFSERPVSNSVWRKNSVAGHRRTLSSQGA